MFNKLKKAYLTIRFQHCTKNLLVFLPVMASHNFEYFFLERAFLCFLCMTAITFGTYFFNDIVDINHDRVHPLKKYRPIASGELKISESFIIGIFLVLFSLGFSMLINIKLFFTLCAYLIISIIYSLFLKKIIWLDAIVLSGLFVIRIIVGNFGTEIPLSFWLLGFAVPLFFALALIKRLAEIVNIGEVSKLIGRGYHSNDKLIVNRIIMLSSTICIVILLLYSFSESATKLYSSNILVSFVSLVVAFWLYRVMSITNLGQMKYDPVLFALTDKISYIYGTVVIILLYLAKVI